MRLSSGPGGQHWRAWWAWFPVRLGGGEVRWFEWVERKPSPICPLGYWDYRAKSTARREITGAKTLKAANR